MQARPGLSARWIMPPDGTPIALSQVLPCRTRRKPSLSLFRGCLTEAPMRHSRKFSHVSAPSWSCPLFDGLRWLSPVIVLALCLSACHPESSAESAVGVSQEAATENANINGTYSGSYNASLNGSLNSSLNGALNGLNDTLNSSLNGSF